MTKIIGLANSCKDCPSRHYYSGGAYECLKVKGSRLNADSSIPDWCPLTDYRVSASIADTAGAKPDLHAQIMNIRCATPKDYGINMRIAYQQGHRDARHAAAELALAAPPAPSVADIEDPVIAPRDLLIAACSAIDKKRNAPNTLAALRAITMAPRSAPSVADAQVDDLRMLVQRLVHALNKASPSNDLGAKALDYLQRNGIGPSPLRESSVADAAGASVTDAARDVLAERQRQMDKEGWTPKRDDRYINEELALAAIVYAESAVGYHPEVPDTWPWHPDWFKPTTPRRDLVKAGALILAEIERLDRATKAKESGND